jgi:hypothetical protein
MRLLLSKKVPANHKLHNGNQGQNIPGHCVLLELAARLPMCASAARAKGSTLTWTPTFSLRGPSGAYEECSEGATKGIGAAALFPLELCGEGAAAGGADLAALRLSVALRGNTFHGTLNKDVLSARFPQSPVSRAAQLEDKAAKNLRNCFFQHQVEEQMEESNMFRCSKCEKSVPVRKKHDVWRLPPYLILNLKRYGTKLTKKGLMSQKSEERVDFPLVGLDLSEFNESARQEFGDDVEEVKARSLYDCVGVVQQHGQMKGGHCAFAPHLPPPQHSACAMGNKCSSYPRPLSPPHPLQTPPTSTSRPA